MNLPLGVEIFDLDDLPEEIWDDCEYTEEECSPGYYWTILAHSPPPLYGPFATESEAAASAWETFPDGE